MIFLVASGGDGGGDAELRFTVPWCETIARKKPPEAPGHVLRRMLKMAGQLRAAGARIEAVREHRAASYFDAIAMGISLSEVAGFELCFRLLDELCLLEES